MGNKRNDNIPIDVKHQRKSKKGKKRKKGKASLLAGLGSMLPKGLRSSSIVARTQTPSRGTTSGGLPSLGKRSKR